MYSTSILSESVFSILALTFTCQHAPSFLPFGCFSLVIQTQGLLFSRDFITEDKSLFNSLSVGKKDYRRLHYFVEQIAIKFLRKVFRITQWDFLVMMRRQRDEESRAFHDLSALVLSLLRSPPMSISLPDQFPDSLHPIRPRYSSAATQISPSGFASLLLGISVALMLCGSVTFFIGFLLLPWVLALIIVFYVAGIVSAISMAGRSVLCYVFTPPSSSRKEISDWKLL